MPTVIVTLKENASHDKLEEAKQQVKEKGGTIEHEYSLIKGFSAKFPDDQVNALESNDHIHVELDGEVRTQK